MRIYKPGEFSLIIGVSIQTLRRWDKEGVLPAHRTPKGTRFYTQEDVDNYLEERGRKMINVNECTVKLAADTMIKLTNIATLSESDYDSVVKLFCTHLNHILDDYDNEKEVKSV